MPSLSFSCSSTGTTSICTLQGGGGLLNPIMPATAFPSECEREVGGVLTILLDPAAVDIKEESIEDDVEDVDGEPA